MSSFTKYSATTTVSATFQVELFSTPGIDSVLLFGYRSSKSSVGILENIMHHLASSLVGRTADGSHTTDRGLSTL